MFIVTDYDGVLIDSRPAVRLAVRDVYESFSLDAPSLDEIDALLGKLVPLVLHESITSQGVDVDVETVIEMFTSRYAAEAPATTLGFDDVIDVLEELKSRGVPVALATLKPHTEMKRFAYPLPGQYLGHVMAAPESPTTSPPKSTLVKEAITQLGLQFELTGQGWMIGDRASDVAAGKHAGLKTIGVKWGTASVGELEGSGCDVLLSQPEELARFLLDEFAAENPLYN